jgi:AI-2 transport protein TqsA
MAADHPPDVTTPTARRPFGSAVSPVVAALGVAVLVGLGLALLYFSAPLINPLLLAFFITTLSLPGYGWLQRRGLRPDLALAALVAVLIVVILGMVALAWYSALQLQTGLAEYTVLIQQRLASYEGAVGPMSITVSAAVLTQLSTLMDSLMQEALRTTLSMVDDVAFSVVLAAFLLLEWPRFEGVIINEMQDVPFLGQAPQMMDAAIQYFFIRVRLNVLTGLGFGLFLLFLGVDYALLWAIWTFVLSFVPYIGLVVASIPPILLAFAEFGWERALIVIIAVTIINLTIENVVEPSYTGKKLNLSPTVVFVSFFFWVWLLGPMGALLCMPITVLLLLVFNRYENTRWLAHLIGRES